MSGQHRAAPQSAAERFAELIRPKRARTDKDGKEIEPRVTEHADFLRMMMRLARALEARAIDDPSILAGVIALAQRLAEIPNVVISTSADRHKINPYSSPSMKEIARLLGITPQSASDRRKVGARIIGERLAAADAASLAARRAGKTDEQAERAASRTEAAREREAIERAEEYAATVLVDFLARKRAA